MATKPTAFIISGPTTRCKGLGIEAQRPRSRRSRAEVRPLPPVCRGRDRQGKRCPERRPQRRGTRPCSSIKAPVLVKLCRLGRDVHFISGLMAKRVPFWSQSWPDADPFCCTCTLRLPRRAEPD
jgi:hypothetical protein